MQCGATNMLGLSLFQSTLYPCYILFNKIKEKVWFCSSFRMSRGTYLHILIYSFLYLFIYLSLYNKTATGAVIDGTTFPFSQEVVRILKIERNSQLESCAVFDQLTLYVSN